MKVSAKKLFEMFSEIFSPQKTDEESVAALLERAKSDIREIRANIDAVNDDTLLDMYIYRLKAAQLQYKHLLKMAKEQNKKIS